MTFLFPDALWLLAMLLGSGVFAFWRNERRARNAEAVAALLDQGEEALRAVSDEGRRRAPIEAEALLAGRRVEGQEPPGMAAGSEDAPAIRGEGHAGRPLDKGR